MFRIANWFNNYQAPVVLMIDDLSDAYINVYRESYKNDWGYLCNNKGSAFHYLENTLLSLYPDIKITFFVPYLRHNVINENTKFEVEKYSLGERSEYTSFLKSLEDKGHEIAHHGSNHGEYIDKKIVTTVDNWNHEWALFDNVDQGVTITIDGVKKFKDICDIDVMGGKYCGYIAIDNSKEIIDKCNFLYWCERPNYKISEYDDDSFGENEVISFPTTIAGNSFVRLSYSTGNKKKDKQKKILKYFQPFYNIKTYINLYRHYMHGHIVSIQEHISPATSSGVVQSANIVSDITSLHKYFKFLSKLSIWYANCKDIAKYIYVKEHCEVVLNEEEMNIIFTNKKFIKDSVISITDSEEFTLEKNNQRFLSVLNNKLHVVNVPIEDGNNIFVIS